MTPTKIIPQLTNEELIGELLAQDGKVNPFVRSDTAKVKDIIAKAGSRMNLSPAQREYLQAVLAKVREREKEHTPQSYLSFAIDMAIDRKKANHCSKCPGELISTREHVGGHGYKSFTSCENTQVFDANGNAECDYSVMDKEV